ncbi:hypothetical protein TOPH_04348 [Tolypocladium ophioglossoides CBS 100239]|uniref:Uncharacterized protein n=1 Tax=Tolypocladium ophioglossoides (strain CBS 100239) TaxID=1163406 RepID=A0A0L0NAE2_TOLOC|nr:hypothetical protein TOPH_04348 [Tolypocladium ophioglossoides CBS 100239]
MAPQDAGLSPKPLTELIRHHREIFVSPLFWTSRHLDLVGCRFEDVENVNDATEYSGVGHISTQPSNDDGLPINDDKLIEIVKRLAKHQTYTSKVSNLTVLLMGEGRAFDERCKGPSFFWAGRSVHQPPYTVFLRHDHSSEPRGRVTLRIGYIDYGNIGDRFCGQRYRELHRRQYPGKPRFWERLSELTPKEWSEDPYLLCILLSIAQRQERSSRSRQSTTHSSRLLVTNASDSQFIYLFEAEIASELLKMLDKPNLATKQTVWPIIKRKRIPYEPCKNFHKRITAELLAPSPLPHSEAWIYNNDAGISKQEVGKRERGPEDDERGTMRQKV